MGSAVSSIIPLVEQSTVTTWDGTELPSKRLLVSQVICQPALHVALILQPGAAVATIAQLQKTVHDLGWPISVRLDNSSCFLHAVVLQAHGRPEIGLTQFG